MVLTDCLHNATTYVTTTEGTLLMPSNGCYTWGPYDVTNDAYTVTFTADVTDSADFAGEMVTNTVDVTADNADDVCDKAVFTIEAADVDYYIYLPLVMRNAGG